MLKLASYFFSMSNSAVGNSNISYNCQHYVIDCECLTATTVNGHQCLLIKELTILDCVHLNSCCTYLFFPPSAVDIKEGNKSKASNNYLIRSRHGLQYNSGLISYSKIGFIARALFENRGDDDNKQEVKIFIKGHQKLALIKSLFNLSPTTTTTFIELGQLDCPKFDVVTNGDQHKCLQQKRNRRHQYCSQSKAFYFANWLNKQQQITDDDNNNVIDDPKTL